MRGAEPRQYSYRRAPGSPACVASYSGVTIASKSASQPGFTVMWARNVAIDLLSRLERDVQRPQRSQHEAGLVGEVVRTRCEADVAQAREQHLERDLLLALGEVGARTAVLAR